MRRFVITTLISVFALSFCITDSCARHRCDDWKQKMMSEKIAFLSMELNLTPEEAQQFWPIYNQVNMEKNKAMDETFKSYHELSKATRENRPEKEIAEKLDAYLDAQKKMRQLDDETADRFRTVLSSEKLARLYVGEERFRRQHIRKLHAKPKTSSTQANK